MAIYLVISAMEPTSTRILAERLVVRLLCQDVRIPQFVVHAEEAAIILAVHTKRPSYLPWSSTFEYISTELLEEAQRKRGGGSVGAGSILLWLNHEPVKPVSSNLAPMELFQFTYTRSSDKFFTQVSATAFEIGDAYCMWCP